MKPVLKTMRKPGTRPRAGSHNSSAMIFDAHWHAHDQHQLLYAFEGAVQIEDKKARFLVPPQLAAFVPARVDHRTAIEGRRSGSVFLPRAWIKPAGDRIRILRVSPLMREMVLEAMRWPIEQPEDPVGRNFFRTFALLCREWIDDVAPLHLPTSDDPRIKKAMDHTQAHLANVRLPEVCRAANLSERSLRRRFLDEAGMSWTEYRHRARLLKALTLLENRHRTVGEVAALVGFESVSAFSKAFHSFTGEGPRQYRKRFAPEPSAT